MRLLNFGYLLQDNSSCSEVFWQCPFREDVHAWVRIPMNPFSHPLSELILNESNNPSCKPMNATVIPFEFIETESSHSTGGKLSSASKEADFWCVESATCKNTFIPRFRRSAGDLVARVGAAKEKPKP